jgi:hypothetical protein
VPTMLKSYFVCANGERIELSPSHQNVEEALEHAGALFAEMNLSRSHDFIGHIEVEDEFSGEVVKRVEP